MVNPSIIFSNFPLTADFSKGSWTKDQCDAYHLTLQICRLAPPSNTELFPHEKLRWFKNLFKNFLVVVKMSSLKLHQIVILTSAFFSCISYFQNGVQGQSNNRDSSNKFFLYMDPLGVMVNYTGQTENGNIPHGFGTGTFLDEAEPYTYMGEWKHGLASGFGQIVYANGDKYTGKIWELCRNFTIFPSLRFYVKSISANLEELKLAFLPFWELLILRIWYIY